jgi:hypothetical protein
MVGPLASHPCPVRAGAGGLIDNAWCLDTMAPVITGLPASLTELTVTRPELLVHRDGPVEVYYTPFDSVNTGARIVMVGICPGRHQMLPAVRQARRVLLAGGTVAQALAAADAAASFAGPTRGNLVRMLDRIGVHSALGIASTASFFGEHQDLADSSSLCNFTVQVNGEDYHGRSPRVGRVPFLRAYVTQVLGAALEMMPGALIVPLGEAVSTAVTRLLVEEGHLDPRRCLLGFPHPSGANNGRVTAFLRDPGDLAARVRAWFRERGGRVGSPDATRAERTPASARSAPASHETDRWRSTGVQTRLAASSVEEGGMKALAGTPLDHHMQTNVHALLFDCPYCGAKPGERCQGAVSYPSGYRDTLHKARERELQRRLDAATAGLTRAQATAVRRLFVNPPTAEERRAVIQVLLRSNADL